jgi:hypothetical protein
MATLPPRSDLDQLRRQAKDLLSAARRGDPEATEAIREVSGRTSLTTAQLALARRYGFPSWTALQAEVVRRQVLDAGDLERLSALLIDDPEVASATLRGWADHPLGASPLTYVAMLRFDTATRTWRDVPGTADLVRALLAGGAAVDGDPQDRETPLITAASYGDADVARALIAAGADLEAVAACDSGGIPGGTALQHAAGFGMTAVLDVLVMAGARVPDLVLGAAAGSIARWPLSGATPQERILALIMAADHQRLEVIDELVEAGTPVDSADGTWDRHPLRLAAENGRPASVRRLLHHGADPRLADERGRTPLDLCRAAIATGRGSPGHLEVEALLRPLTE